MMQAWKPAHARVTDDALPADLTRLLNAWMAGDSAAGQRVVEEIYANLHQMARQQLAAEHRGSTLQATALVNEVYLRLAGLRSIRWEGRVHFFGSISQMIRRVLVDHARKLLASKRGGGLRPRPLEEALEAWAEEPAELLDLHEALKELSREDPMLSEIVLHRFFGGFNNREIGELTGRSPATIKRRWRVARAWLFQRLASPGNP